MTILRIQFEILFNIIHNDMHLDRKEDFGVFESSAQARLIFGRHLNVQIRKE
jgi:hypothetical protein